MTTVEVVEAVQRTLENEGILQVVRAQLRANVLRIIASGPEYVPKTGKVVSFINTREGLFALNLVREMLCFLEMKESLTIFDAESGIEECNILTRSKLVEDLCISRADPETSLLQQIILPYLTNQGGNPEQHRNKTDTYSDFKATVFSDQIRDTGAKDLWPAEAKSDNPITSEEDFKYGDTMHAVGDSDFEDDEDLQEFSQVDAPLVSDAPSKQPNTDANIAGFIDESSSFEQSNTGDMNTFESQKFEIGERKSFSEKNVSSKGNPDDDSPSASVQTEEDHKDSGSEYDFVEMVSKNEKVVSGEDQKDSTDRESGKSVMPTQLYITEEVKKDSESNEDDDGSRGVPEYNSGDKSEQGEIGSSSKQDVVESSTAECFLPSETERNDGNFTIQGTSSSASNSRATITRLSHNATSRAQRGWNNDEEVAHHDDVFNDDIDDANSTPQFLDSEQKQSKVTIEAKSARQAALEVCDFVVEEEEDDEDSDYDKNADDSRENDVRNVSNNQMEDENLDEGDGDDVLNEEKSRESSFDHDEDKRECAAPKNAQYAFGSPERIDDEDEYGDDDFDDDFEKSDNEDEQHESSKPYHSGSSPLTHEPANLEESTGGDVDDIHSIEEEDDISVGQDSEASEEYVTGEGKEGRNVTSPLFQSRAVQDPVRSTQPARRTNFDSILNDTSDDESAGAQEEDFQYNQYIDKADEAKIESPGGSNAHDDNASCGKDEGSLASENLEEFSTGGDQHHSEDDSFE